MQRPSAPGSPAPQRPEPGVPGWLLVPLGLLLVLFSVGCSRERLATVLPRGLNPFPPPRSLAEVLPGTWKTNVGGHEVNYRFGRHGEVSMSVPVDQAVQAYLHADALWMGGRYKIVDDTVEMTFSDGQWAAMAARQGMSTSRMRISDYDDGCLRSSCKVSPPLFRVAPAPAEDASAGEARDLAADEAPKPAQKPGTAPVPAAVAGTAKLQAEQDRLSAVYARLQARRRSLDPKNAGQLAAFNKDAAEYTRQAARLSAQAGTRRGPVAVEGVVAGNPARVASN